MALIAALGQAAEIAEAERPESQRRLQILRDLLQNRLEATFVGRVQLNGHPTDRLPNTLNVSIDGLGGADLLAATPQIAAATGAACHETESGPSGVLVAMGLPSELALSAVRLTLGRWTTEDDIDQAARALSTPRQ